MNKRQISGFEAAKRIQELWINYAPDLESISEMADEKIKLDKTLELIESAAAIQSNDLKGEALLKKQLKEEMSNTVYQFALRARVKAHQAHDIALEQELSHTISYYFSTEAELALARATATKNKIKNNLTLLNNITAENVVTMETTINKFESMITVPQSDKKGRKVTGTDQIAVLNNQLDDIVVSVGDLIHSYFPNTLLSQEYDAKSKIGSTVARHNHVVFHIETADTHEPLTTAHATKTSTHTTIAADTEGMVEFETVKAGKQAFLIEASGYTSKTVYVIVNRSTTTELVVQLETE